jgi:hypothetical protein
MSRANGKRFELSLRAELGAAVEKKDEPGRPVSLARVRFLERPLPDWFSEELKPGSHIR